MKTNLCISIINHQYLRHMVPNLKTNSEISVKLCLPHGYLTAWKAANPKSEKAWVQLQYWLHQKSKDFKVDSCMVMNWDVKEWLRELQTHKSKLNPENLKSRKLARFPFKVPKVAEVFSMSRKNLNPGRVKLLWAQVLLGWSKLSVLKC